MQHSPTQGGPGNASAGHGHGHGHAVWEGPARWEMDGLLCL